MKRVERVPDRLFVPVVEVGRSTQGVEDCVYQYCRIPTQATPAGQLHPCSCFPGAPAVGLRGPSARYGEPPAEMDGQVRKDGALARAVSAVPVGVRSAGDVEEPSDLPGRAVPVFERLGCRCE